MDRLHHLAIQVSDIARSVAWYRERFDVDVAYRDDSWALLRFANVSLALVQPDQHPPHMAVERDDAMAFGTLTPHRDGTASVYVADPDGNAVEILKTG